MNSICNKIKKIRTGKKHSLSLKEMIAQLQKASMFFFLFLTLTIASCRKLISINPPVYSITTSQVFADSINALSAIEGLYSNINGNGSLAFGSGYLTIYCGSSADELLPFSSAVTLVQFSSNSLLSNNSGIYNLWAQGYFLIYQVNAIIEGLNSSTGISGSAKNQFIGEAKFFRAFVYYYLVNLFGDVPDLNSSNFKENALSYRQSTDEIYSLIVSDLLDASKLLGANFSSGGGEHIRANRWAALALLARVYLFQENWASADSTSSAIIGSGIFQMANTPNDVFLKNSSEAILQWQNDSKTNTGTYNANPEGNQLIPVTSTSRPYYYVTSQLLGAFEPGDFRRIDWLDSTIYSGTIYYYPYKYKVGPAQESANGPVTEYYTVLRLAEQYLIRAEAEAHGVGGGLSAAIADMNIIRHRAGLPDYTGPTDQTSVLNAIYHEDQIEFFAEWGHRWFDLKRTGRAHEVLSAINYKQPWQGDYQLLYPIPYSELQADPNLTQNSGY